MDDKKRYEDPTAGMTSEERIAYWDKQREKEKEEKRKEREKRDREQYEKLSPEAKREVDKIEEKIKEKEEIKMKWGRGRTPEGLDELRIQRKDLLYGTNSLAYHEEKVSLKKEIDKLKELREDAWLLKRYRLEKRIKDREAMLKDTEEKLEEEKSKRL